MKTGANIKDEFGIISESLSTMKFQLRKILHRYRKTCDCETIMSFSACCLKAWHYVTADLRSSFESLSVFFQ